jgi:hypothetical protein
MTVTGIQAQWHEEDACELITDWGFLSPEALSQVQMQESDPSLVKPSYTLSFCCKVSGYSINSGRWSAISWICHAPGKELNFIGHVCRDGDFEHNPLLKSWVTLTVTTSMKQIFTQLSSVTTEDQWIFCVWETQWGHFIPAGNRWSRQKEAHKTHIVLDIRPKAREGRKTYRLPVWLNRFSLLSYISAAPVMSLLCSHVSLPSCPHCGI